MAAERIATRYREVVYVLPRQWKGQVPKDVHQEEFIRKALGPEELLLLTDWNKGELKQILDAVGIGLYQLGRLR